MKRFVIASLRAGVGKTSVAVGLAEVLDKKVGYLKPFGDRLFYSKKKLWDHDAALMANLYDMDVEDMSLGFDHSKLAYAYNAESIKEKVASMAAKMEQDRQVLLVEAGKEVSYGLSVNLDALSLARDLDAEMIMVIGGDDNVIMDDAAFTKQFVEQTGVKLTGVIINKVHDKEDFEMTCLPKIEAMGLTVLGVMPRHDDLGYYNLKHLSDILFAKVLTAEDQLDRRVKNIFIGALSGDIAVQRAILKKEDTLVITGGDRTDMILAALESNVAGIILTNNILPPANIVARVEESGTPMLLVSPDTYRVGLTIERMEPLLNRDEAVKISQLKDMIKASLNLAAMDLA